MRKIYLLDCTLRDGGYINDWRFGRETIKGFCKKIARTGIEILEVGFIKRDTYDPDQSLFPDVQSFTDMIQPKSENMMYVGMLDMSAPIPLDRLVPCDGSSLDGIRVIFKKEKIEEAYIYCKRIMELGYKLFVNFVGTDLYTDKEFIEGIQKFNTLHPFALSIVDSFGLIKRKHFLRLVYLADNNLAPGIILAYHAHNNLQQAFGNAEALVEMNLKRDLCIDACVFGMGRGAGNLNLELFAEYMNESYDTQYRISITPLIECGVDKSASGFLNRWLDATKTALFFSKGNIFVEGIAEAILIPELAKVYLRKQNEDGLTKVTSLEEAGISVINMNGIYFPYFMQLYNGYSVIIPNQKDGETKKDYKERVHALIHKDVLSSDEFVATKKIEARCVAITDNDPETNVYPSKDDHTEGNNPQLYYAKQIENMTENCRVFINRKTFEYDLALESRHNAKMMLEILIEEIPTDGSNKRDMEDYIAKIDAGETIDDTKMAGFILKQVDSNYMGKGRFAQLLAERINSGFVVPEYINNAISFILMLGERA